MQQEFRTCQPLTPTNVQNDLVSTGRTGKRGESLPFTGELHFPPRDLRGLPTKPAKTRETTRNRSPDTITKGKRHSNRRRREASDELQKRFSDKSLNSECFRVRIKKNMDDSGRFRMVIPTLG